jgi:hypothetical protein
MGRATTFTKEIVNPVVAKQELTGKEGDIKGVVPGTDKEAVGKDLSTWSKQNYRKKHNHCKIFNLHVGWCRGLNFLIIHSTSRVLKSMTNRGKQVDEVNLSKSIAIFHAEEVSLSESFAIFHEEEPLEEVNLSDSFALFDDNSHVSCDWLRAPKDKVIRFEC